jgi:hypothetical protein
MRLLSGLVRVTGNSPVMADLETRLRTYDVINQGFVQAQGTVFARLRRLEAHMQMLQAAAQNQQTLMDRIESLERFAKRVFWWVDVIIVISKVIFGLLFLCALYGFLEVVQRVVGTRNEL